MDIQTIITMLNARILNLENEAVYYQEQGDFDNLARVENELSKARNSLTQISTLL